MAEEIKNTPEVKVRYSDEELQEFKAIILEMLEKAKKEYKTLRDVVTHDSSNDIEDTSPTFKVMEEGAMTLSKEEAVHLPSVSTSSSRTLRLRSSESRTRHTACAE